MESSQRQRLPTADLKEVKCWHENDVLFFLRKEPNHSSLKLLHIDCKISLYYVIWIANVLKSSKLIVELVFARYYSGYVCNDGMIAIFEALSNFRNTILTNLDVPGATMNYAAVVAMGHMLKTNESLTKLTIDRCYIKSNGASIVGDSLKQNTTLKSLYLQYNDIGDVGAIAIADGIKEKRWHR